MEENTRAQNLLENVKRMAASNHEQVRNRYTYVEACVFGGSFRAGLNCEIPQTLHCERQTSEFKKNFIEKWAFYFFLCSYLNIVETALPMASKCEENPHF